MPARTMIGLVRPHVLDAGDGILTSAGICEGLAGADVRSNVLFFAAGAALAAGAVAMAITEYAKACVERDRQLAEIETERTQIATAPDVELEELTELYRSRGLSPELARQVAVELTAHDALQAHAEAELGITPTTLARPLPTAIAAGVAFGLGAALPLITMVLFRVPSRPAVTFGIVILALGLTGWVAARISHVHPLIPVARTAGMGVVAMAITYFAGQLIHL